MQPATLIVALVLSAQPPEAIEPPLTNRPIDFSNIVGTYEIEVEASPTKVRVEQPITVRIALVGTGPAKYEPGRAHLNLFPSVWNKDFYVEEMRDEHSIDRARKRWEFVYRLRPKHTKIKAIEDIKLVSYNPKSLEEDKYETRYADRIAIVVEPVAGLTEEAPIGSSNGVDEWYYRNVPIEHQAALPELTWPVVVGMLIAPPTLCLLGAWGWKRCRPTSEERRRRLRLRAAERVTSLLGSLGVNVADAVVGYLSERFGITFAQPTPMEVANALLRQGFGRAVCAEVGELLQACDADRYGQVPGSTGLAARAVHIIATLEADPCAR